MSASERSRASSAIWSASWRPTRTGRVLPTRMPMTGHAPALAGAHTSVPKVPALKSLMAWTISSCVFIAKGP